MLQDTSEVTPVPGEGASPLRNRRDLAIAGFFFLLALAVYLYPHFLGLLGGVDYDEGVYTLTAEYFSRGVLPYRDVFLAHPPAGILAFMPFILLRQVLAPALPAIVVIRWAMAVAGAVAVAAAFLGVRRSQGLASGVLVAELLLLDFALTETSRRAMLEPLVNLWSALAILVYLVAGDAGRRSNGLLWLAGVMAGLAALTKVSGVSLPVALLLFALFHNRRQLTPLLLGLGTAALAVLGFFLAVAPSETVRETVFFQLLRPVDGVADSWLRVDQMINNDKYALTSWLAVAGGLVLLPLSLHRNSRYGLFLLWAVFTAGVFLSSRSYYDHYFAEMAFPLAFLAGGIACREFRAALGRVFGPAAGPTALFFTALVVSSLFGGYFTFTSRAEKLFMPDKLQDRDSPIVARRVRDVAPSGARVFTMEPAYADLSGTSLSEDNTGWPMVDSYGELLIAGEGILQKPWSELWASLLHKPNRELDEVFRSPEAQKKALAVLEGADFAVLDGRAEQQLSEETLKRIRDNWHKVADVSGAQIYQRPK